MKRTHHQQLAPATYFTPSSPSLDRSTDRRMRETIFFPLTSRPVSVRSIPLSLFLYRPTRHLFFLHLLVLFYLLPALPSDLLALAFSLAYMLTCFACNSLVCALLLSLCSLNLAKYICIYTQAMTTTNNNNNNHRHRSK